MLLRAASTLAVLLPLLCAGGVASSGVGGGESDGSPIKVSSRAPRPEHTLPLLRYYSKDRGDHLYLTSFATLGEGKHGYLFQGVEGYVLPRGWKGKEGTKPEDQPVPLYRYFNKVDTDHYYSTDKVPTQGTRVAEGVECLILGSKATERGTVPLYAYYNAATRDHMLTTDLTKLGVKGAFGWKFLGAVGRIWPNPEDTEAEEPGDGSTVPVRRFFNQYTADHLLTNQRSEDEHSWYGWAYQGIAFYCYGEAQPGTVPLKLYYNAAVGDHIVTASQAMLGPAAAGWQYESDLCHVKLKPATGLVPLYRYYSEDLNDHYYSTNGERLGTDPNKPKLGWVYQGIECYVLPHGMNAHPALPDDTPRRAKPVFAWWNARYRSHAVISDPEVEKRLEATVGLRKDEPHGWSRAVVRIGGRPQDSAFLVFAEEAKGTLPLYAFYEHSEQDYFYTTRYDEGSAERSPGQWRSYRGIVGYVDVRQSPGTVPLYRYYNGTIGDTIVTTEVFPAAMPYQMEGMLGFVPSERVAHYATQAKGSHDANLSTVSASLPRNLRLAPLYQFLSAATGTLELTASQEADDATDAMAKETGRTDPNLDAHKEGTHYFQGPVCYCSRERIEGSDPLYAFRSASGVLAYSTAKDEFSGWGTVGNVACYVFKHRTAVTVPLFRYVSRHPGGGHLYTTSKGYASDDDWKYQGIQAYVYPAAVQARPADDESHPVSF